MKAVSHGGEVRVGLEYCANGGGLSQVNQQIAPLVRLQASDREDLGDQHIGNDTGLLIDLDVNGLVGLRLPIDHVGPVSG